MRSSSGSDSASRGIAKLSVIPSAAALRRSGTSRRSQVSANATSETPAATAKTGPRAAANASR